MCVCAAQLSAPSTAAGAGSDSDDEPAARAAASNDEEEESDDSGGWIHTSIHTHITHAPSARAHTHTHNARITHTTRACLFF